MTTPSDLAHLPPLYARWMSELLPGPIPAEAEATCDDCAMCDDPSRPSAEGYFFDRATKCCTYLPEMPNFLVGAVLSDVDAAYARGRESVVDRLRSQVGVTPLGFAQPPRFRLLFQNTITGFGHSQALRCPHYVADDGGRCGIWSHRESTCCTWFCKHARGPTGKSFWNRLHLLLTAVERGLSRWCLLEAGLETDGLRELFPFRSPRDQGELLEAADLEGTVDPDRYALVWGRWHGREEELYARAAERVAPLSWPDVQRVCGSEVAVHAHIAVEMYGRLTSDVLSERLAVGAFQLLGIDRHKARVQTYSLLDPLDLPRPMFDVLPFFDGRPIEEVQRDVVAAIGEPLSRAALLRLADFQILRSFEDGPQPAIVRFGVF